MSTSSSPYHYSYRKRMAIGAVYALGCLGVKSALVIVAASEFYPFLAPLLLGFPL